MLGEKVPDHAQDELIPDLVCTMEFEKVCYEAKLYIRTPRHLVVPACKGT